MSLSCSLWPNRSFQFTIPSIKSSFQANPTHHHHHHSQLQVEKTRSVWSAGLWRPLGDGWTGLLIFSDNNRLKEHSIYHFSGMYSNKPDPRFVTESKGRQVARLYAVHFSLLHFISVFLLFRFGRSLAGQKPHGVQQEEVGIREKYILACPLCSLSRFIIGGGEFHKRFILFPLHLYIHTFGVRRQVSGVSIMSPAGTLFVLHLYVAYPSLA